MAWWNRSKRVAADEHRRSIRTSSSGSRDHQLFKGDSAGEEGETRALDDITVDIDRGEYISISGPSGCGKSTMLSILGLLDAPSSGRYWFNGRRVDPDAGRKARCQRRRRLIFRAST